jgi:hypothetical protein
MMRRYFGEFNRVRGDNIRLAAKRLRKRGMGASVLPHKTALVIERPDTMNWVDFSRTVLSILQPQRGSVMLSSESTGRTFICQNRGNRPRRLERQ